MRDLTGKVAFITGAAGGIGLGIATALAEHGVRVALADIDEATLAKSTVELPGAVAVPLDVTDRDSWAAAVEKVRATSHSARDSPSCGHWSPTRPRTSAC